MIHVVLDTNVYRNNPKRDNLGFQAIEKLAGAGWLKLHIPYVIEREFQTQQREICLKDLKNAQSGLLGLTKKHLSEETLTMLGSIKNKLEVEWENILLDAEQQFVEWSEDIDANRYPLCLEQTNKAMEAYFKGLPPLTTPKERKDIPDSFIVQAISKLCLEHGSLHVVSADQKIVDTFYETHQVTVYKDLSELIASEIIQNELKDLDVINNIDDIKESFESYETEDGNIAERIAQDIGNELDGKTISDSSIPDDNHEATIVGYDDAEDIKFDFNELIYYGNGQFGIPFNLTIVVNVVYYIFKSDYYCMEEGPSVTDHNDHYFEAEDEFEVMVGGTVSISIDRSKLNVNAIYECIDNESISIDEIQSIELCHSET